MAAKNYKMTFTLGLILTIQSDLGGVWILTNECGEKCHKVLLIPERKLRLSATKTNRRKIPAYCIGSNSPICDRFQPLLTLYATFFTVTCYFGI